MRDHWYCGNIPPRPLDDKRKDFEFGGKKKKTRQVWTNQNRFWKKVAVFFFFFSKREREDKSVRARSHNQRREVRKTVVRYERGEG
jgi:hypothetical protein